MGKGTGGNSGGPGGGRSLTRQRATVALDTNFAKLHEDQAAQKAYLEHADKTMASMPSSQKSALVTYTGSAYVDLNRSLRGMDKPTTTTKALTARIDKAFEQPGAKLPQSVMLYRGVGDNHPLHKGILDGSFKIGSTFEDKGFQSTSTSPTAFGGKLVMRIRAPKGAKALHIEKISDFSNEKETLLPRNAKLRVTSATIERAGSSPNSAVKKIYVDVEYVD